MVEISRRDFMKGSLVAGVLGCIPSVLKGSSVSGYDVEWDEAIRENVLREQIGYLMDETNTGIVYTYRREDGKRITGMYSDEGCFVKAMPVRHLRVIRQKLLDNFVRRNNGNSYNYATIYVRDESMSAVGRYYCLNIFS